MHLTVLFFLFLLSSCATMSPEDNFRNFLVTSVGSNIHSKTYYEIGFNGNLIGSSSAANGNSLNIYRYTNPRGECRYELEVEPDGKIVNWKILTGGSVCYVSP